MSDDNTLLDCIVIGAGPSGCVFARELARKGKQVLILERREVFSQRVGETLPPPVTPLLKRLGLWHQFLLTEPLSSPGNLSLWDGAQAVANDFIFSPYGCGWHVDRAKFDSMLVAAAREDMVDIRLGAIVKSIQREGCNWRVFFSLAGVSGEVTSKNLVLATGRSNNSMVKAISRKRSDKLLACYAFLPSGDNQDCRTWIEAVEQGWWYTSGLPSEKTVVAYFTDADLLSKKKGRHGWLNTLLSSTCLVSQRTISTPSKWHIADARSGIVENFEYENILLVGDAALSQDPLSSSGLMFSLESSMKAAEAFLSDEGYAPYQSWLSAYWLEYLSSRKSYYGQVNRWPQSEFWMRRQTNLP